MNRKTKIISAALCAAALGAATAQAASIYWNGSAGDGVWTNTANWTGGVLPTSSDLGYIENGDTVTFSDGMTNTIRQHLIRGNSTLNVTGGKLNESKSGNSVRTIVGGNSASGTLNVSAELYEIGHQLRIGAGGDGVVNLFDGSRLNVYRGGSSSHPNNTSISVYSQGTLNITNTTLATRNGIEILTGGEVYVHGGSSTINLGGQGGTGTGDWYHQSNGVLRVGVSTNGLSTITLVDANDNATPSMTLNEGAVLDVSFVDGAMETNFWPVIDGSAASINNLGMVFADSVDTNDWGFIISNNVLYVGYGLDWPAGEEVLGPPVAGRTLYWTGTGGDALSDNPTNWVLDTAATIPATWGPYDSDLWRIGYASVTGVETGINYVVDYDGTAVYSSHKDLDVGNGAEGTLNMNSGTLAFTQSASSRQEFGVGNADGKGTLNLNSGSLTLNAARFGVNGAEGNLNLNGGTLTISRQYGNFSLQIGVNSGSTGTVTVTGGRIFTRGGIQLGASGGAATGIFSVEGSAATSLGIGSNNSIDGRWLQHSGSVLKARMDDTATGVTPILIDERDGTPGSSFDGDVYFYDGSVLDVGWMAGVTNYGSFDVMTWEGQLQTNELAFADSVDTNIWSFAIVDDNEDGTNDTLRVTAYGETANGTPLGWLSDYGLTAADDEVDNDGDGLLTWEEYVAGTDPTSSASALVANSPETIDGGQIVITWQSVAGKSYSIITNSSLVFPNKGTEAVVTGLDGETSYTGTVGGANTVFYEVGVE